MRAIKADTKSLASIGLPILILGVLTALNVAIFKGMAERDRLESRNDSERTMNVLFSRLRDHDDFGSAIEGDESLRAKVLGLAAYASDGSKVYAWGLTPSFYPRPAPAEVSEGADGRSYLDNPKNDSIILVLPPFGNRPPPQRPEGDQARPDGDRARPEALDRPDGDREPDPSRFFFTTLRRADFFYLEIRETEFWARRRAYAVLFPLVEAALAALVLFVRGLIVRNAEYRMRIEEQKNLVVLGTAASTLAHEIKNPLLSIKLQARILERTCPDSARRELGIIDDEVERLSALSHRVGDYLRDPVGNPRPVDPRDVVLEVGLKLCGRDILSDTGAGSGSCSGDRPCLVAMDPERLRSVLENLVRNALESGGRDEDVSAELATDGAAVVIDVLDRGQGLAPGAVAMAFDPFFTTKSRGTGIGLAVSKRFVLAAGGGIALEPRSGGGCRARISLPAAAPL